MVKLPVYDVRYSVHAPSYPGARVEIRVFTCKREKLLADKRFGKLVKVFEETMGDEDGSLARAAAKAVRKAAKQKRGNGETHDTA